MSNGNLGTLNIVIALCMHVVVSAVLIYDIWATVRHGRESTVSAVILSWAKNYPIVPFVFGLVCGHLFWSQN